MEGVGDMSKKDRGPLPDRVCSERGGEHFHMLYSKIGVVLDGKVVLDAHEACASEGWVKRFVRDERGRLVFQDSARRYPALSQELGKVELYWR
jgi:hypothetical protein